MSAEPTPPPRPATPGQPSPRASSPRKTAPARHLHQPTRDFVTTINDDGSRYDLHPADVHGVFTRWRRLSALGLIAFYLLLPWIPVNGYPALFLDLASRRFHFFGYTLAAQDAWLLFFGVTGLGFTLFFLTALFGRLWCGWACPQTVFLEHVYRRIERWIDGDAPARRALQAAPLSAGKILRRTLKHGLYALVTLAVTHLFLAYFISIPELWRYMQEAPGEHWTAFLFVFLTAAGLYFNFAWFREQLCIVICPYGRLQSALTDDNTMVIGYDAQRGEPRMTLAEERRAREARLEAGAPEDSAAQAGACVACNRCVQVCPTGIDIRQGLQLECIGCAACVDACDDIMDKVKRPRGLIRYDSHRGLAGQSTRWIRPRTILYAVLMLIGAVVAYFAFAGVKPANFIVFRMTGAAYYVSHEDVRNQFMVRIVNKLGTPASYRVTLRGLPAQVRQTGLTGPVTLEPLAEQLTPLVIFVERHQYRGPFKFTVEVADAAGTYHLSREIEFLGPDVRLLHEEEEEQKGRHEEHREEPHHG